MSRRRLKRVIDEFPGHAGRRRRGIDGIPKPKDKDDVNSEEIDDDLGQVLDEYEQDRLIKRLVIENERANYQTRVIYIGLAIIQTIIFINPFSVPLNLSHPCRYKYPLIIKENDNDNSNNNKLIIAKCERLREYSASPFRLDGTLSILAISTIWLCVYWLNYIDPELISNNNKKVINHDDHDDDSLTNYLNPRPLKLQHSSQIIRYITPLNIILSILCAIAAFIRFIIPRWKYIDYLDSIDPSNFIYDLTPPGFTRRVLYILTVLGPYSIYLLPFANILIVLWLRYWINSVDVYGLARFRYKYKGA